MRQETGKFVGQCWSFRLLFDLAKKQLNESVEEGANDYWQLSYRISSILLAFTAAECFANSLVSWFEYNNKITVESIKKMRKNTSPVGKTRLLAEKTGSRFPEETVALLEKWEEGPARYRNKLIVHPCLSVLERQGNQTYCLNHEEVEKYHPTDLLGQDSLAAEETCSITSELVRLLKEIFGDQLDALEKKPGRDYWTWAEFPDNNTHELVRRRISQNRN